MPLEFGFEVFKAQLYMPQTLSFYPQLQPETTQHVIQSLARLSDGYSQMPRFLHTVLRKNLPNFLFWQQASQQELDRKEKKRKEKKRKEKKRKEKRREDCAFLRDFNEKPRILPSCPVELGKYQIENNRAILCECHHYFWCPQPVTRRIIAAELNQSCTADVRGPQKVLICTKQHRKVSARCAH